MSDFIDLMGEIGDGMSGKNRGLPMGFHRLNRYIGIRKRIYTLVFGPTGSGKSSFVHSAFILNPFEHWWKSEKKSKFKVILFSQERSKVYIFAKWLSRKIFLDTGILIQVPKMLGWWSEKLTADEHDLLLAYEDYFGNLLSVVDVIQGANNPTGIYKYVQQYARANGKEEKVSEYHSIYIPNDSSEIVVPIVDTFGNTKMEKGLFTKKDSIDKVSEYFQYFRDFYGYSPVGISQVTRNLNNPMYTKLESFEPTIDDAKESGRPAEDADSVISLFDPHRYNTNDPSYQVDSFIDEGGSNFFRKIKILKNTYGEDSIGCGMAFMGSVGIFKELPSPSQMESFDYRALFTGDYFLNNKNI